jgi:hypothetical protein
MKFGFHLPHHVHLISSSIYTVEGEVDSKAILFALSPTTTHSLPTLLDSQEIVWN